MSLTPKQEKFCLAYVETGNASEAYRQAYDAENMKAESIHVNACKLLKGAKVALRVVELQEENRERHNITVGSLTTEYEEAREIAKGEKQGAAMVGATTGKAKLHGMLVDKQEHKHDLSDAMKEILNGCKGTTRRLPSDVDEPALET